MDARSVKKSRFVIMLMSFLRVNLHFGTNITIFFNNITTIRCFFLRILSFLNISVQLPMFYVCHFIASIIVIIFAIIKPNSWIIWNI